MESLRESLGETRTYVVFVIGILGGLALGLLIGWVLWPLELKNAAPSYLHPRFRDDYLLWVAEQYPSRGIEWAREKLGVEYWDKNELSQTLEALAQTHGGEVGAQLRALRAELETAPPETQPMPAAQQEISLLQRISPIVLVCGIALLVAAFVGGVVLLIASRHRTSHAKTVTRLENVIGGETAFGFDELQTWGEEGPPQAQFVTTYTLGDDHYDPSFAIELEDGEFMGECGVGISETIGIGEPSKVTAFEVWLFDKNDIRTVTKVLMSDYAFHDQALYTKLAPKGEPVLAKEGEEVFLETKKLRVRARIVEMAYGVGNLPPNSFFERMKIELAAWVKSGQEATRPMSADIDRLGQGPLL